MSELVLVEVSDRIATITINRPEQRNALTAETIEALSGAMRETDQNPDVDVIILTGAGKAFCAGLDLKEMAATGGNLDPRRGCPWPELSKPVIGAVNGPAVTGGLELALACDFLIASTAARFADTHTRVGLIPFWGMSVLLPEAIGIRMARQMSLTGNFVNAQEALRIGLVNLVVEPEALIEVARRLASDIVEGDQSATKAMIAQYKAVSAAGSDGRTVERKHAETFLGGGVDAAEIERRRLALIERAKLQA